MSVRQLTKPFRFVRERTRWLINELLHRYETTRGDSGTRPLDHPPIFIVGAPRSGSTLLYQVMTERFDVGYLANAHCRWFGGPSVLERLRRPLRERPPRDYSSQHGRTNGATAPSECGDYWYRFFPRDRHHVTAEDAPPGAQRRLRAAVRMLIDAFGSPVVFKNLYCTLRMQPIGQALPEAVFIVIRRDEVANGHSLLVARHKVLGTYDEWWAAEPPGLERLRILPPEQQVVEQVRAMHAVIDADRELLGAERFHEVRYDELAADPHAVLDGIAAFLAERGVSLRVRADVPTNFERPDLVRIEPELYDRLQRYAGAD